MSDFEVKEVHFHLDIAAENADSFWETFHKCIRNFRENLLKTDEATKSEQQRLTFLRERKIQLEQIQNYITLSTISLPPYDRKRSQEMLEQLRSEWKEKESVLAPKKKFAFSNRDRVTPTSTVPKATFSGEARDSNLRPGTASVTPPPTGSLIISEKNCETISLLSPPPLDSSSTAPSQLHHQLYIKNNQSSRIVLPWLSGSVRIEDCENCQVYLGPCMTSVYLEGAKDCVVYAFCHQLRIHNCQNCTLYGRVNSHPIIEDCERMKFAPYTLSYPLIEQDIQRANLSQASCWDNVVDFRWLKAVKSPNWDVLPESEREVPPLFDHEVEK